MEIYNLVVYLEDEPVVYDTAKVPYRVEFNHIESIHKQMNELGCDCVRVYEYLGPVHIIPKRRILGIDYWSDDLILTRNELLDDLVKQVEAEKLFPPQPPRAPGGNDTTNVREKK